MKNNKVIPDLLGWTTDHNEIEQLSRRKEQIFREIVAAGRLLTPLSGVVPFLKRLRTEQISCAVASSTPRENIDCIIESLGVGEFFQTMVCAEDVTHGKPDPEVFLLAGAKLRRDPAYCLVFEDAHVGIEAARRAGMKVVAVSTTHPAESLQDADRVVSRLDALDLSELNAWFEKLSP